MSRGIFYTSELTMDIPLDTDGILIGAAAEAQAHVYIIKMFK